MNYGKQNASKKQKNITSKSAMKKKKMGVRIFKACLIIFLILCISGVAGAGIIVKKIIDHAPDITPDSIKPQGYMSTIYADDGITPTDTLTAAGSNRVYKTIDEIPEDLQHAFVAIEDSRFYTHKGIDPQGILRAAVVTITSGGRRSEGASTITQQLIKNNVFPNFIHETKIEKIERKIQEQYLALQIEKQMSKQDILENYLNSVNLGQNTLGVQAAAKRYFNKDVSELTLSECATIAVVTNSPGKYNPITNPEENAKRKKKLLGDMLEQEYIDQTQYDEALNDDVYARIQDTNVKYQEDDNITSYFNDALTEQLMKDMTSPDGLGYTDTQAYNAIYGGGLSIYSTQNLTIQNICDEELNKDANFPKKIEWGLHYALTVTHPDGSQDNYNDGHVKIYGKNQYNDKQGRLFASQDDAKKRVEEFKSTVVKDGDSVDEFMLLSPQPQSSVTVMDHKTGQIKAMVGGRGPKTTNRSLNRAYGTTRQAGSCFKILAVYAPALDSAGMTLADVEVDEPYNYQSTGQPIRNWWGKSYRGPATLRKGIEQSMNIIAVKVINKIGVPLGYEYCQKFGISTLDSADRVESLALGGITHGVYNYELAAAYATIANGGVYNEPILYTKVLDHDGNVLIENKPKSRTVLKETTAALLTNAMEDVIKKGTAAPYAQVKNMAVAGKTGTTNSAHDFWFSGYSPYYTCTIWMGYDDNKEMTSHFHHERIWARIMTRINEAFDLPYTEFEMPRSLHKKSICSTTGKLASDACPAYTEWFESGTEPSTYCDKHVAEPEEPEETEDAEDAEDAGEASDKPEKPDKPESTEKPDTSEKPDKE